MDSVTSGANGSIHGYNMFAYCFNNPINLTDETGHWPSWNDIKSGLEEIADWVEENIIQPIEEFANDIAEDCTNYDKGNTNVEQVMESNYFSSYNGTLVIRHSNEKLTSWAYGGTIYLNHDLDEQTEIYQEQMVKHEYGHALQEEHYGTLKYTFLYLLHQQHTTCFHDQTKILVIITTTCHGSTMPICTEESPEGMHHGQKLHILFISFL